MDELNKNSVSNNFIKQIIDADLASNKYSMIKTRFPPEPNGYLHIGHAKSICLNFGLARDYQGTCHLRFDDTNPEKESMEYIDSIKEDVRWLGYQWDGDVCYSSDYFDALYHFAEELIGKGLAYVDELSIDEIREYRGTLTEAGKNSPFRNKSVEENLVQFRKMRSGEYTEGAVCLRAKIDMASSFIVLRDPVLYRIKYVTHHQTGDDWCIYPTYDFTHCISDAIEHITHSLCTLEFQDNRRLYDWVLENITIEATPHQYEFSRLNLEHTMMSKRKLQQLVVDGVVDGWDDPRMPTISGLRRRGYTPTSIKEFCKRIGVTKQDNLVELAMLEACIREELNEMAPRLMAVLEPITLIIENYPDDKEEWLTVKNHPTSDELGVRQVPFSKKILIERDDFKEEANKKFKRLVLGKKVRLRGAYVITATRVERNEQGEVVTVYCNYDEQTLGKNPEDGIKPKGVIHWVCAKKAKEITVCLYDVLFNDKVVNVDSIVNPHSLIKLEHVKVEPALMQNIAMRYQFERIGYFFVDPVLSQENTHYVMNRIVGLKDSYNK